MNRLPFLIIILCLVTTSANAQRYNGYRGYRNDDYGTLFRLGLHGGWSYRIAKIDPAASPEYREYLKGLKSGYHYGANAMFFFNRSIGMGIEYSAFGSKNEADIWMEDPNTKKVIQGKLKDDISISFIGPSFNTRAIFGANDNLQLIGTVSLGYMSYQNNAIIIFPFTNTAATIGILTALSFDVAISKNISLGLGASVLAGTVGTIEYIDAHTKGQIELEDDKRLSLSRVDLSGGIRINL